MALLNIWNLERTRRVDRYSGFHFNRVLARAIDGASWMLFMVKYLCRNLSSWKSTPLLQFSNWADFQG